MTTTFTDYVDGLLAQKDAFTAIFDPEGAGMMAIENIITMVLINGLPGPHGQIPRLQRDPPGYDDI